MSLLIQMDGEDIGLRIARVEFGRQADADAALEAVFQAQYPRLINVLTRLTRNRAEAEELAADALGKLANRAALFRPGHNLEGWLYRTAMNLGLDALKRDVRRRKHEQAAAEESVRDANADSGPLDDILRVEARHRVRVVLARLRPVAARALLLRHSGFSYREVAQVTRINVASVGKLLLRSTADFERTYRALYGEPS